MVRWLLVGLLVATAVSVAGAQPKSAAVREHRVALVIGNAAYADAPLNNPGNDAKGMAEALRNQGFEVIDRVNADVATMRRAAAQFGERLRAGGENAVGLFYYSGHGMQVNGRNFLVPIGAEIPSEDYVAAETFEVDSVLGQMDRAKSRVNIVILDACAAITHSLAVSGVRCVALLPCARRRGPSSRMRRAPMTSRTMERAEGTESSPASY